MSAPEQIWAVFDKSPVEYVRGDALKAAVIEERHRAATCAAIHSQYPITTDYDRGYAQARKDAAAAIRKEPTT